MLPDRLRKKLNWCNNRYLRSPILMLVDAVIITFSLLLAFWLRFDLTDGYLRYTAYAHRFDYLPWLIGIRWLCGWAANIYRWSFSHASLQEGGRIIFSVLVGTVIFAFLGHVADVFAYSPPRSIYAMEAGFTLAGLCFLRFFPKYVYLFYRSHYSDTPEGMGRPVVIYGAGGNAEILARELSRTGGHGYELAGFVDDDKNTWGFQIHGRKVLGGTDALPDLIESRGVKEILVAIPGFSGEPLRRLVDICGPKEVKFKIVPPYPSVLARQGKQLVEDINPESLLERQLVEFDQEKINKLLGGKTVLVTGAGGSIGSELCRQTAALGIKKLLLFDLNENELYFLHADLRAKHPELDVRIAIGSVRDRRRVDALMSRYRPHLVFHAAAHKHVPLMEGSPCEALKNNVLGTFEVAESALLNGAESFTLVSTDKAVASANVMGASKALAEAVVRDMAKRGAMRCSTVRFGNVLGSNGSLLQIIKRQIAAGGPITITHKDMTRYFMAIPEAVGLILMATALEEGQTYILDMGQPIKVDKLIRQIVMLSGMTPGVDIEIRYTRPRPGEKLYEELYTGQEALRPSSFPRIDVVAGGQDDADIDIDAMLAEARRVGAENDNKLAWDFLSTWVADYSPQHRPTGDSAR